MGIGALGRAGAWVNGGDGDDRVTRTGVDTVDNLWRVQIEGRRIIPAESGGLTMGRGMPHSIPLRPFLPADTLGLRELFAQSIEELTQEDYDEDQRAAWAGMVVDSEAFSQRLAGATTLVVEIDGELSGFGSLKDNRVIDMLYVHPHFAGSGVGSALLDALERLAKGRGAETISVDASDTAQIFFEERGYVAQSRNSVPVDDQWLMNTTMTKTLAPAAKDKT